MEHVAGVPRATPRMREPVAAVAPTTRRVDPGGDDLAKAARADVPVAPSRATGIAAAAFSVLQSGHQTCKNVDDSRNRPGGKAEASGSKEAEE